MAFAAMANGGLLMKPRIVKGWADGEGNLVSVAVTPGRASFETGEQRVLFPTRGLFAGGNHTQYNVTPDDRRFVFARTLASNEQVTTASQVIQVDHWFTELRQRGSGAPPAGRR